MNLPVILWTLALLLLLVGVGWLVYQHWPEMPTGSGKASVEDTTDLVMKCKHLGVDWSPERTISTFDCK